MRIGINLLCILPGVNGGVEMYAVSTLRALAVRYSSHRYVAFVNREGTRLSGLDAPNITTVVCDFNARSRELRYAWEQFMLPRQVRRHRLDLLHSPGYQGPLRCPCPAVVTIPDLNFIAFRKSMALHRRTALSFFCTRSARRAARVITISHFSKSQIVEHLGIPENRITVTHLGPGVRPSPADWDSVCRQHGLSAPYVVAFAGNNHPHKNLPKLFEAFGNVRTSEPVNLAIIGGLSPELRKLGEKLNGGLIDLGVVESAHVLPILGHARLCVFPSLYEGFGLPVLEAQSAGVPLACSNAASIPEVAGRGAMFFDPRSASEITSAIEHCLADRKYCDKLVLAARENLKRFSWEKTADETMAVYLEAAGISAPVVSAGGVH